VDEFRIRAFISYKPTHMHEDFFGGFNFSKHRHKRFVYLNKERGCAYFIFINELYKTY